MPEARSDQAPPRCALDSGWCDGLVCEDTCPRSVASVAKRRGCIPPAPCGRGAGANGTDLPCDCEAIALDGQGQQRAPEVER